MTMPHFQLVRPPMNLSLTDRFPRLYHIITGHVIAVTLPRTWPSLLLSWSWRNNYPWVHHEVDDHMIARRRSSSMK